MLQNEVIGIYCLIDDILKEIGHYEERQRKVSDSEIITKALVSALYFKGNQSHAAAYMRTHHMIPLHDWEKRLYQAVAQRAAAVVVAVSGNGQAL